MVTAGIIGIAPLRGSLARCDGWARAQTVLSTGLWLAAIICESWIADVRDPAVQRRIFIATPLLASLPAGAYRGGSSLDQALRKGLAAGGVLMFRHALAPGTFDPPGFDLGDCATQRNLNDEGRRQAVQIGTWFGTRRLRPARVRSSPWCRCLETARLAFGDRVEPWAALGSPRAGSDEVNAQALEQLRAALAGVVRQRAGFEAWVTHMFVFSALLGEGADVGDGVLLGLNETGAPQVMLRLAGLAA